MRKYIPFILLTLSSSFLSCGDKAVLDDILSSGSDEFTSVLTNPAYEVQIIYGKITEEGIIHYTFGDSSKYYYPASSVKMLAAFAAVKKLQELNLPLSAIIELDSTEHHPRFQTFDSLFSGPITIDHLLTKIFVYSDNNAYNVLYQWLGKDYINQYYRSSGINTRIVHQLSESAFSFTKESNSYRAQTKLIAEDTTVKTSSEQVIWMTELNPLNQMKGAGYTDGEGELVNEPFDFSQKNYVPLLDMLTALEAVVLPEKASKSLSLDESRRSELIRIMQQLPKDLPSPIDTLGDNYGKFFMFGDQEGVTIPKHIQILNKVGWAYGYLTDVAFINDSKNDVQFFLAATIHVNENNIYNDGNYQYEEVGLPFLGELGRIIYNDELASK